MKMFKNSSAKYYENKMKILQKKKARERYQRSWEYKNLRKDENQKLTEYGQKYH